MTFPRAFQTYIPRTHCIHTHVYGAILITPSAETVVIRGRKSGKWSFPKGHGSARELPLEACIRELKEETGIDLVATRPNDEIRFKSGTYFIFYVPDKILLNPEDTNEVMDSRWVSIYNLVYLRGNKDLSYFANSVNIDSIVSKMRGFTLSV